jgi:hypothetical protein
METNGQSMKAVFTVVDRGAGKSYWTRVGVGFVNRDGSITLKLDALPTNGTLQVREWESREEGARRNGGDGDSEAPAFPGRGGGGGGGGGRPRRDDLAGGSPPLRRSNETAGGLV